MANDKNAEPLKTGSFNNSNNKGSEKDMQGGNFSPEPTPTPDINRPVHFQPEHYQPAPERKKNSAGRIILIVAGVLIAAILLIGLGQCDESDKIAAPVEEIAPTEESVVETESDYNMDEPQPETEDETALPEPTSKVEEVIPIDEPKKATDNNVDAVEVKTEVVENPPIDKPEPKKDENNMVYSVPEINPQFPGGDAALYKYLSEHLEYPTEAQEEGVSGRVVVQFVVTKEGKVGDVKIVRGRHPALDREAVRVVKSLPKFIPARNNGHPVNCYYTLPVTFKFK